MNNITRIETVLILILILTTFTLPNVVANNENITISTTNITNNSNSTNASATDVMLFKPVKAIRNIDKKVLMVGSGDITVTVYIQNNGIKQAIALTESIPLGWALTRISDNSDSYKDSYHTWVWLSVESNAYKIVKYKLYIPFDAIFGITPANYNIIGYATTSGSSVYTIGDDTITVITIDILTCYKELGMEKNMIETRDLLKAADDWSNNVNSPCLPVVITTSQLLEFANQWRIS